MDLLIAIGHIAGSLVGGLIVNGSAFLFATWMGEKSEKQELEEAASKLGVTVADLNNEDIVSKLVKLSSERFSSELLRNRLSDFWRVLQIVWSLLGTLTQAALLIGVIWYTFTESTKTAVYAWSSRGGRGMPNRILLSLVLVALATPAFARDYRCTIRQVVGADMSSGFVKVGKGLIGKEFTVDRRTGIMAGALKNSWLTEPQVIDPGSKQNSFKVINTLPKTPNRLGSQIYALNIDEYYESPKKPFVFLESATVYLGECEHF